MRVAFVTALIDAAAGDAFEGAAECVGRDEEA